MFLSNNKLSELRNKAQAEFLGTEQLDEDDRKAIADLYRDSTHGAQTLWSEKPIELFYTSHHEEALRSLIISAKYNTSALILGREDEEAACHKIHSIMSSMKWLCIDDVHEFMHVSEK